MASLSSLGVVPSTLFLIWVLLISPVLSQTCKSQTFKGNNLYANCVDLPTLSSYLHSIYDSTNCTLSITFLATLASSNGWISWAFNPTALKMIGAQALVEYKDSTMVVLTIHTYNISGYALDTMVEGKLDFDVWDKSAEEVSGVWSVFAKVKISIDLDAKGVMNHVWQVGLEVSGGVLVKHDMSGPNLNAVGTLDLAGGQATSSGGADS